MKWIAVVVLALVACRPAPALTPFAAAAPNTPQILLRVETANPTQTPKPLFVTFTPAASVTSVQPPQTVTPTMVQTDVPTMDAATATPAPMVLESNLATWTPLPSWTPPPPGSGAQVPAHFLLEWPIANRGAHSLSRLYPYGGSYNGRLQVHHGVDLVNPLGTPLLAAGDGTVLYAGDDFSVRFGPDNNYYGYLVVIQHYFMTPEREPVFTLYGHMLHVGVQAGQVIRQGDVIGTVGQSGVARGPHVHFEVRVGYPFDFGATRNPELWLIPYPNNGVLAGRVADENGTLIQGVTLHVQAGGVTRSVYSYTDGSVNPDPLLGENFLIGDLPPDYYVVSVTQNGQERFAEPVYVEPDRVTWIDVVLKNE